MRDLGGAQKLDDEEERRRKNETSWNGVAEKGRHKLKEKLIWRQEQEEEREKWFGIKLKYKRIGCEGFYLL